MMQDPGYSKRTLPNDEFTVTDFFEGLSFLPGGLHLRLDYVRGRSVKTDITWFDPMARRR